MIDGLLIIDKPVGPTSHDVVARMRRTLGERRIGHTGTLDPLASGVLPLVIGRATRLARFISSDNKAYEAEIELGTSTTTYDSEGEVVGAPYRGPWPCRRDIELALLEFKGTFSQTPPRFSAKKIGGRRSYRTARAEARGARPLDSAETARRPEPVLVSTQALELLGVDGQRLRLRLECSAGFYVRSLAYDLGHRLGTGAHLAALRRTRSGDLTLDQSVSLEAAAASRSAALAVLRPTATMLPGLPSVTLSAEGVRHASRGQDIGPGDTTVEATAIFAGAIPSRCGAPAAPSGHTRLLDPGGQLVAIAEPSRKPGFLHPLVVLV